MIQEKTNQQEEKEKLKQNLHKIKNKIVVLSGKGGVGKSTVAVNLAVSLANLGHKVGLLDIDIHGPSVPKLLNLEENQLSIDGTKMIPVTYNDSLKVMSIGFMIESNDSPVVWRGPLKHAVIKQFLIDVSWGELDYLIIDSPPGTGDEPLAICQLMEDANGAIIVTTPQDVSLIDVRKSISFCHKVNMHIIGVVENMSGFTCPHCNERIDIFKKGGGEDMAQDMNVPFLGTIPIDRSITLGGDSGSPIVLDNTDLQIKKHFETIVDNVKMDKKFNAK